MVILTVVTAAVGFLSVLSIALHFRFRREVTLWKRAVADFIHNECEAMASVACDAADQSAETAKAVAEFMNEIRERLMKLESGAVPDYEASAAAAKAVNDFSAGITSILGFDPVMAARKMRQSGGEEVD